MGLINDVITDPLKSVSFTYWGLVFFAFGCVVGSFLNVCIHRLPLGESIVNPPSHCPKCGWRIPWYFNIPIVSWIALRGKCYNCGVSISPRYIIVEFITGVLFLLTWVKFGANYPFLAIIFSLFIAGLITASFIDFEHYIIPDEITIGGIVTGILISILYPDLHGVDSSAKSFLRSVWGVAIGGGLIYIIVQIGKLIFGRYKLKVDESAHLIFTDENLIMTSIHQGDFSGQSTVNLLNQAHKPDIEEDTSKTSDKSSELIIPYSDIFSRESDCIAFKARTVELHDRCFWNVEVSLSPKSLRIGEEEFDPETISFMEVSTDMVVLPREAMGFGDVKYMAAIGAFLGWDGVFFSLCASSIIGALVGATMLLFSKEKSTRVPYGPFISVAALIWVFFGKQIVNLWLF